MYCKYCGKELKNEPLFCGYCGKKVKKSISEYDSKSLVLKNGIKTSEHYTAFESIPIAGIISIIVGIISLIYNILVFIAVHENGIGILDFGYATFTFPLGILYIFFGTMLISCDIKKAISTLKKMQFLILCLGIIHIITNFLLVYTGIWGIALIICSMIIYQLQYGKLAYIAEKYYNTGKTSNKHLSAGIIAIIAIPFNILLGRYPEILSVIVMFTAGSWFVSPYKNSDDIRS